MVLDAVNAGLGGRWQLERRLAGGWNEGAYLLEQHWKASDRGDIDTEHAIYAAEAVLDYPQSGERFRGRSKIQAQRGGHPAERRFTVERIRGGGDLWVSECVITYEGVPTYSVSVMELTGDLVMHETQYFADPFPAPASRAALAE